VAFGVNDTNNTAAACAFSGGGIIESLLFSFKHMESEEIKLEPTGSLEKVQKDLKEKILTEVNSYTKSTPYNSREISYFIREIESIKDKEWDLNDIVHLLYLLRKAKAEAHGSTQLVKARDADSKVITMG